jgi:prevent-host-death family protein
MNSVNVHDAKTNLSGLLARVESGGETIVICRNGLPVADLVPHRRSSRVKPHPELGRIHIGYDPVAPLGSEEWPEDSR